MSTHQVVFLHFNDVYHISKQEDVARFMTQLQAYRQQYVDLAPYTVFSGDVFSPSLEASILRGAHMLPLLEELKIDLGCYGNHDFDFGEKRLGELAAETHFPWLLSNAIRNSTEAGSDDDGLLADAQKYHTATLQGVKVGFFGLAGTDWPSNCRELPPCTIASPVETARACARHLRRVEKCDIVVGVTHMRLVEDIEVSEALRCGPSEERVDLLLGGHDHNLLRRYAGESSNDCADPEVIDCSFSNQVVLAGGSGIVPEARGAVRIVKSGTDWKGLSCVRLQVSRTADGVTKLDDVTVEQIADLKQVSLDAVALSENRRCIEACLRGVNARIDELGAEPLLQTAVALEGSGALLRSEESNLGNMLADMVRAFYDVDIALVNSGSVRCDKLIQASSLTVRDLIEILPFDNALVVKRVSSTALLDALENSFSDAHTDGRFLQFAGLAVVADWTRREGHRIIEAWHLPPQAGPEARVRIRRGHERSYTVAMVAFIADGFDGYSCFGDQETLVGEEGGITDTQLLLRTLGYEAEAETEDEARIKRAREAVVTERDNAGLPIVAPRIEDRIVVREARL